MPSLMPSMMLSLMLTCELKYSTPPWGKNTSQGLGTDDHGLSALESLTLGVFKLIMYMLLF